MSFTQLTLISVPGMGYGFVVPDKTPAAPPTLLIVSTAPITVSLGRKYYYQPVAVGVDHWALSGAPSDMTFNAVNGEIKWFPLSGTVTSGQLTLTAYNSDETESDVQVFTVSVNTQPRLVSTPPDTASAGVEFTFQVVADDPEYNIAGNGWTLVGAPAGLTINISTGLLNWVSPVAGTYTFTVRAADIAGLYDQQLITLVVS